jgi:AAA domain
MPNAREPHREVSMKILALGLTGAGKTTQFLTLPGRKFIYIFDPNAILTLQGFDVDYEEFLPDNINLDVKSLSKDKKPIPVMKGYSADVYSKWELDFEGKMRSGFFNDYDWLGFDSFTTLSSMVMDSILKINGRPDSWPGQDDYGPQMLTLTNIFRQTTSLGIGVYATAHIESRQDKVTKKVSTQPMMTGRLANSLPLLFSEIFLLEVHDGVRTAQTQQDNDFKTVRTSMRGLDIYENVDIDFSKEPVGQGIGGLINWYKRTGGKSD